MLTVNLNKNEKMFQMQIDLNKDLKEELDLKRWCCFTLFDQ